MKFKTNMTKMLLSSVLTAGLLVAPFSFTGAYGHASAATATSSVAQSIAVYVDGAKLSLDPQPVASNGSTLVPMRAIFKALHANVTWEASTKTILAVKGTTTLALQIGSKKAVKNGKSMTLTEAPKQIKGATMVPLRFIAEALSADVQFDSAKRIVRITSAEAILKKLQDAFEKAQAANQPKKLTTTQIVALNDKKVVTITTDLGQGSGVVIGSDEILTNFHVITGASSAQATLLDGSQVDIVGIEVYNEDHDLAILKTKKPLGIEPVDIGYGAGKGDHVTAIGSPLGVTNTVSDGLISNIVNEDGTLYYQISVPIDHGSSGGALFDDYGQLVGITSAGYDDTAAQINFAVASVNVMMLIYDLEDNPPSKIGFLPSDLPTSLKDATDADIVKLMEDKFSGIQSVQQYTELKKFEVKRDADGWITIQAVIDPSFYMLYGHKGSEDLRYWALDTGYKLRQMLPDNTIRLVVYFDQTYTFQPKGFPADQVTAVGDGTWRVRFPVVDYQGKDHAIVQVFA